MNVIAAIVVLALWAPAESAGDAYVRGAADFRLHHYKQAADELLTAVQQEPDGSPAWRESVLMLAQSLYLSARAPEAIPWLEKARAFAPAELDIDYMLGNSYIQNREPEKSVAAFARLFGLAVGAPSAHVLAGRMMMRQEFEEAAETELHRALELNPRIPQAHYMLGEIATYHGRFDEAVAELKQEIALNPGFSMAYYKLGDAWSRSERWDRAIPELERAVWLDPAYSGPYILLGKAYFKQNRLTEAENILRRALKLDPRNASASYLLGQTLVREGQTAAGKQFLERAESLNRAKDAGGNP